MCACRWDTAALANALQRPGRGTSRHCRHGGGGKVEGAGLKTAKGGGGSRLAAFKEHGALGGDLPTAPARGQDQPCLPHWSLVLTAAGSPGQAVNHLPEDFRARIMPVAGLTGLRGCGAALGASSHRSAPPGRRSPSLRMLPHVQAAERVNSHTFTFTSGSGTFTFSSSLSRAFCPCK